MATESEVLAILRDPFGLDWSIQGFGMLRLYLGGDQIERLHIWDQEMAVENVSSVHDHPWDLDSRIISGTLRNQRFVRDDDNGEPWQAVLIRTGEGGHVLKPHTPWSLRALDVETYQPGEQYHQDAPEIHESIPERGTVTVVRRTFSRPRDIATSCFKEGSWVSAEPRTATKEEVERFVALALEKWSPA